MMKEKRKILAFVLIGIFAASCSLFKVTNRVGRLTPEKLEYPRLNLKMIETHAWIGKLPGKTSGRVNISGKFLLKESIYYDWTNIKLEEVRVFQNNKKLFVVLPEVKVLKKKFNGEVVVFSTIKGIEPPPYFTPEGKLAMELIFKDGASVFTYKITGVKIEKAY